MATTAGAKIDLSTSINALTGAITLNNGTSTGGIKLTNSVSGTGTVLGPVNTGGALAVTDTDSFGITQIAVLTAGTSTFTASMTGANIALGTQTNLLSGPVTLTTGGNATLHNGLPTTLTSAVGGALTA